MHFCVVDVVDRCQTSTMAAAKMTPLPTGKYVLLLTILVAHSIIGGYWAGTRPNGAGWRFFSWHPMLMMLGEWHDFVRIAVPFGSSFSSGLG